MIIIVITIVIDSMTIIILKMDVCIMTMKDITWRSAALVHPQTPVLTSGYEANQRDMNMRD
jgi:hypothetical protein